MRLDDRARAFAVGDGHDDRARIGAVESSLHRYPKPAREPIRHVNLEGFVRFVGHLQLRECVRVQVNSVPRIESVGDDVFGFAVGLTRDHCVDRAYRPRGEDRSFGHGRRIIVETGPNEHAIIVHRKGFPATMAFGSERETMPWANDQVSFDTPTREISTEVRTRSRRYRQPFARGVPRHQLVAVDHETFRLRPGSQGASGADDEPATAGQSLGTGERSLDPGRLREHPVAATR